MIDRYTAAHRIDVHYDQALGYPTSITVDQSSDSASEGGFTSGVYGLEAGVGSLPGSSRPR